MARVDRQNFIQNGNRFFVAKQGKIMRSKIISGVDISGI